MIIKTGNIAQNRKARFNFSIEETFEAGIVLVGTEVKSLRQGKASISESYAEPVGDELFLINADIPEYQSSGYVRHKSARPRKLLLKKKEINKLVGLVRRKGYTLVPLSMYFNDRGFVKISIGLAVGKDQKDKRDVDKDRTWKRDKARIMRARNK